MLHSHQHDRSLKIPFSARWVKTIAKGGELIPLADERIKKTPDPTKGDNNLNDIEYFWRLPRAMLVSRFIVFAGSVCRVAGAPLRYSGTGTAQYRAPACVIRAKHYW